jgi:predicted acyl esterase
MGRRGKQHNRGSKHLSKGPQLSDDERLWKRLSSHFSHDLSLWDVEWSGEAIANLLIERENLGRDFAGDGKAVHRDGENWRASVGVLVAFVTNDREA